MSFRKVMEVLFPEASKIVGLRITRTQAGENEKKDNGVQHNDKIFVKQAKSIPTIEPDFYDVTFKLQA